MNNKLFRQTNIENEIYHSMEKQLVANQNENVYGLKKIEKAVSYLSAAASIFNQAGMIKEAQEIVKIYKDWLVNND